MICKTFKDCFCIDLKREEYQGITLWKSFLLCFYESRVLAVVLMRLSQYFLHKKYVWRLSKYIKRLNEILTGFECHLHATIDEGLFLAHTQNIVVGEGVVIGSNVTLYNSVTLGAVSRGASVVDGRYPIIGDGVIVYTGARILGNVRIDNDAIIGANAVVLNDVPSCCVAVGVPAKIVAHH